MKQHPVDKFIANARRMPTQPTPLNFGNAKTAILEFAALLAKAQTPEELAQSFAVMYDGHTPEDACYDLQCAITEDVRFLTGIIFNNCTEGVAFDTDAGAVWVSSRS